MIDSHSFGVRMQGRAAGERWLQAGCLAAAVVLHVVLMGATLWWPSAREYAAETSTRLVMVELTPMPPTPPVPLPPRPMPMPSAPKRALAPEPAPELLPAVIDAEAVPAPEAPMPTDSPAERIDTAPSPADAASTEAPATAVPGASAQQVLITWQAQLLAHLQRYRGYPRQAKRLHQQGVSYVRFSVDRQGRISQPRLERASGHRLLDEETIATVQRANPVPPPPPEVRGNPVEVVVPVSFYLRRR